MIVLSDNIATRALIRELGGREIVNAEMDALGVPQLRLHDSLQQDASYFTASILCASYRWQATVNRRVGPSH
jgi:beta-lactamase class A